MPPDAWESGDSWRRVFGGRQRLSGRPRGVPSGEAADGAVRARVRERRASNNSGGQKWPAPVASRVSSACDRGPTLATS